MKSTLFLVAAAALARVAFTAPIDIRDDEDIDDECGVPEPEPSFSPSTAPAAASSAPAAVSTAEPTFSSSVSSFTTSVLSSSVATAASSPVAASPTAASSTQAASSSAVATPSTVSNTGDGPNPYSYKGLKAGLSGFVGIAENDLTGFNKLADNIGWYSDYTATTPDSGNVKGIPMLWGDGQTCLSDTNNVERLQQFKSNTSDYTPAIMMGFYEPDCDCPMSSNIQDPTVGASQWNDYIAPLAGKGTVLGSPSMCKQRSEDWLQPFLDAGATEWDVTNIHVNKNSLDGVKADLGHYMQYGKPLWISELACVDDQNGFTPCSDQSEIDSFLQEVIPFLQQNDSVIAYAPSNGEGLGTVWPLFTDDGDLSATGQTYLSVLQGLST